MTRGTVKIAKLYLFFLGGFVLLIYNEGTFGLTPRQVCQTSEFIFGWVKF